MDNMITEARKFMSSDEGKDMMDTFKQSGNEPKESDYTPQQGSSGSNSFPSGQAQYGEGVKSGNTYTAQNNAGDGGDDNNAAADHNNGGNDAQNQGAEIGGVNKNKGSSDYDGYEQGDSSATGGWGANEGGDSFARANQLGAETKGPFSSDPQSNANGLDNNSANRSGTSTPAYREEDEMDSGRKKTQGGGGSSGLNPYGNNEEDVPSNENNPYHEQGRRV